MHFDVHNDTYTRTPVAAETRETHICYSKRCAHTISNGRRADVIHIDVDGVQKKVFAINRQSGQNVFSCQLQAQFAAILVTHGAEDVSRNSFRNWYLSCGVCWLDGWAEQ